MRITRTPEEWKRGVWPGSPAGVPLELAMEHAVRKWRALQPGVLRAHGLKLLPGGFVVRAKDGAPVAEMKGDGSGCVLCMHYRKTRCAGCPLTAVRSGRRCVDASQGRAYSPWGAFYRLGDAGPMWRLVYAAAKQEEAGARMGKQREKRRRRERKAGRRAERERFAQELAAKEPGPPLRVGGPTAEEVRVFQGQVADGLVASGLPRDIAEATVGLGQEEVA